MLQVLGSTQSSLSERPLDERFRVNCAGQVVVKVAAFGHLTQERQQQVRILANALEVALRCGPHRKRRMAAAATRGNQSRDKNEKSPRTAADRELASYAHSEEAILSSSLPVH